MSLADKYQILWPCFGRREDLGGPGFRLVNYCSLSRHSDPDQFHGGIFKAYEAAVGNGTSTTVNRGIT